MKNPHQEAEDAVNAVMAKPMELYGQARLPNEIDLVAEVRQRMVEAGLGEKLPAAFDNNRFVLEAVGKTSHAQQYNLNRYFSLQFMAAKDGAQIQRYSLIYEVNAAEWLTIFDGAVLPALLEFDLPIVI